jgi:hypothetical protein
MAFVQALDAKIRTSAKVREEISSRCFMPEDLARPGNNPPEVLGVLMTSQGKILVVRAGSWLEISYETLVRLHQKYGKTTP